MYKSKPKNYCCLGCGREQYVGEKCRGCGSQSFEKLEVLKERELRELLQNTIDVMTYEQLKRVYKSMGFNSEFHA